MSVLAAGPSLSQLTDVLYAESIKVVLVEIPLASGRPAITVR